MVNWRLHASLRDGDSSKDHPILVVFHGRTLRDFFMTHRNHRTLPKLRNW